MALLSTVNPASRKTAAYDVGIRNAKQVGGFGVGDALDGDVADVVGALVGVSVLVGVGVVVAVGGRDGGGAGGGHFDVDALVRAPSRLPKTTGADNTERIGAR